MIIVKRFRAFERGIHSIHSPQMGGSKDLTVIFTPWREVGE